MRVAVLILGLFLPFSLSALTLREAVDLTLAKNPTIEEQEALLGQALSAQKKAQGGFYPTLNAKYQTANFSREDGRGLNESSYGLLELRYNLFNGFSDFFSTLSAQALKEAQAYKVRATRQDVVLEVKRAYITLLKERENLKVAEESLKLLEEQRREAENFYQVGAVPKNTLLKVEVELMRAKQTLLVQSSALKVAQRSLESYVGQSVDVTSLVAFWVEKEELESEERLEEIMWKSRPEILYLEKNRQAKRYEAKGAQSGFYPKVDVVGEYRAYGDSPALGNREGIYNDRTEARVEVSWNLFNGFIDKQNSQMKRYALLSFESQIAATKRDLKLQLFNALESYKLSLSSYEVAKSTLEQAEENYRISFNRYKEQMETSSELLDAELLLMKAKTSLLEQRHGIALSLALIERIIGREDGATLANP